MLNITHIIARDLPDLWFQAVYNVLEHGRQFEIDRGSYAGQTRLEFDYFIGRVMNPAHGSGTPEILPDIPVGCGLPNPVEFEYIYGGGEYTRSYIAYFMTDTKLPGESYTYGERLVRAPLDWWQARFPGNDEHKGIVLDEAHELQDQGIIYADDGAMFINQIELIIWTYLNKGHRNNQLVLQVAQPGDCYLQDPPCLRHIDTRIQDGKLHFFVYFRSWDLWGGLPANLAAIEALHQYMAAAIEVEQGEFIVESKGLHLYGYAEKFAKMRTMREDT